MNKSAFFNLVLCVLMASCSSKKEKTVENDAVSTNSVPDGMVYIPSGTFMMGGKTEQADYDEFPRRKITISSIYMDITEVTNAQFKAFVDATDYITTAEKDLSWEELKKQLPPGTEKPHDSLFKAGSLVFSPTKSAVSLDNVNQWWRWQIGANWQHPLGPESSIKNKMDHPVVHVSHEDALAYCQWARKRLPTEAEWEWAAMGGKMDVIYPWGNDAANTSYDKANFWQGNFPYHNSEKDGFFGSSPVKSFPPNGYGLYDMAGNVWEWCRDKYHDKAYQQLDEGITDPKGPEKSFDPQEPYALKYVTRGGSFLCSDSYCSGYRVSRRMKSSYDTGLSHTGFRCVKDTE